MLALTLAAVLSPGAPIPPPRSRPVYVFAEMTPEQAQQLAGKTIRVRANITDPDPECAGAGEDDDVVRWVVWRKGDETADEGEMVVEGWLAVKYVPSYFIEGQFVQGFYRFRRKGAAANTQPAPAVSQEVALV